MVPLSLIGVSYSVAAFPVLVQMYQKKDIHALWGNVISAMRHIIFWSIPVVCFAVVLRAHIVRVLYGSGEFTWTDTRLTAAVFALMIISLAAQGLSLLFMRTFYAMKYSYMPLIGQVAALLTTFLVSYFGFWLWDTSEIFRFFLEALFRVEGIAGTSIMIVGIAYALSSITLDHLFMDNYPQSNSFCKITGVQKGIYSKPWSIFSGCHCMLCGFSIFLTTYLT
jgi:peptidoglycan biosynthesis protein MviN/MurJ (putative lipid II flippase)